MNTSIKFYFILLSIPVASLIFPGHVSSQLRLNPPASSPNDSGLVSVLESSLDAPGNHDANSHFDVSPELNELLTDIVLKNMPHQYESDKKWGHQEKRWDGISFRRDQPGARLETKRRYKMVNHGTWRKYSAQLANPEDKFSVELREVKRREDGKTRFWLDVAAELNLDARQSKWVKGVQLYSLSAEGIAKIRLSVLCDMDIGIDFGKFPPDLVLQPTIQDAKIHVDDFRLSRVSKAGGEFAQQVARRARRELDKKISEKEQKLVNKLNDEILEKQDDLRISTADAIKSKWFSQNHDLLPEPVKNALTK